MAALTDFHSRILPMVPACPEPTVNQAIIDACVDFCERTHAIQRKLDPVYTAANSREIEFDIPAQTRLVRLISVQVDGTEIQADLEMNLGLVGVASSTGKPNAYGTTDDGTVRLYPTPDKRYTIQAYAALKPSRSATTLDDALFEDWSEYIASGALYRLLSMGATWSNPAQAKMYFDNFIVGSNRAMLEARRRRTAPESQVQFVRI